MTLEEKLKEYDFHNTFQFQLNAENTVIMNFSERNADPDFREISNTFDLGKYISRKLESEGKKYAIGGYGENRVVYRRFKHFNPDESEERSVHLGTDVWLDAGEPLFAPLDGKVHSYNNNDNRGDYGGTIILQHKFEELTFYTLYGHLSLASLENLKEGQAIEAGEEFATLGNENENGGWPPHLHFQVIKDLEGFTGDYPGVATKSEAGKYLENCPDPKYILGLH